MSLWMVRAGKYGEREAIALDKNLAIIGWEELPDLSQIKSQDDLRSLLETTYPLSKTNTLANYGGQIWAFLRKIETGDLIVLPLKSRPFIAIGRVTGPYEYRKDLSSISLHVRPVNWLKEIPRSAFAQALLYSFGAFMTICRIQKNNAEEVVRHLLEKKGPSYSPKSEEVPEEEGLPDLESLSIDQIRDFVARKFKGHGLARLVAAVLEAQGYSLTVSPPGSDGGADIVAGMGPMGFISPKLVVQVKSGDNPIDSKAVLELQGTMKDFQADHGLLVSWSGFKKSLTTKEIAKHFFGVRFWNGGDLIRMILAHYDKFPKEIQAELPLKRIWTLVPDDTEE
ncbi:MAG: restriction endonuclease [Leptospirales bacterium]